MYRPKKLISILLLLIMMLSVSGAYQLYFDKADITGAVYGATKEDTGDAAGNSDKQNTKETSKASDPGSSAGTDNASGTGNESGGTKAVADKASDSESAQADETKSTGDNRDSKSSAAERTITATASREAAYEKDAEGNKKDSAAFKAVKRFWKSLTGKSMTPAKDRTDDAITVVIKGNIPEGVKAEVKHLEFAAPDSKDEYKESPLFAFDLILTDAEGNVYIPEGPLDVSISGKRITESAKAKDHFRVYSYEENAKRTEAYNKKYEKVLKKDNKKSFYAADVLVFDSAYADKADKDKSKSYELYRVNKEYKDGTDAVRYAEDKEGLSVTKKNEIEFSYTYGKSLDREAEGEEAKVDSARFVLSAVDIEDEAKSEDDKKAEDTVITKAGKITASDGRTYNISVKYGRSAGIPEDTELKVTEITEKDDSYDAYMDASAEILKSKKRDFVIARAFDITIVDKKTGAVYQPNDDVTVSIRLMDEKIKRNTDISVVHFEDPDGVRDKDNRKLLAKNVSADQGELLDNKVRWNGDIEFTTDGFSVFTVLGTEEEKSGLIGLLLGDNDPTPTEVTLTFKVKNGEEETNVCSFKVPYSEDKTILSALSDYVEAHPETVLPSKEHYSLVWCDSATGKNYITDADKCTADRTLYARFKVTLIYGVTHAPEGFTPPTPKDVFDNEEIGALPEAGDDKDYRYNGWFTEDSFIDPSKKAEANDTIDSLITKGAVVDGSTTLHADYVELVTLSFHANGEDIGTLKVDKGDPIGQSAYNKFPTDAAQEKKPNCNIEGWYSTETFAPESIVSADSEFNANTDIYVHFNVKVVFYKEAGHTESAITRYLEIDEAIGSNIPEAPEKKDYRFDAWYYMNGSLETKVVPTTKFQENTDVTARFIEQITITFEDDEGTIDRQSFTVDKGDTVTLIQNPIKPGSYRFDGWFFGNKRISNSEGIVDEQGHTIVDEHGNPVRDITAEENMTLHPLYVEQLKVRFLLVNPETPSSQETPAINEYKVFTIDKGSSITESKFPGNPKLSGYEFQGWYGIKPQGAEHYKDIPVDQREGVFVLSDGMDGVPYVVDETKEYKKETISDIQFDDSTEIVAKFVKMLNITFQYENELENVEAHLNTSLSDHVPQAAKDKAVEKNSRLVWYKDGQEVEADHVLTKEDDNKLFVAHYIEQVTLHFSVPGQSGSTEFKIDKESSVAASGKADLWPTAPEKDPRSPEDGSKFIGWYDGDDNRIELDTLIYENKTGSKAITARYGFDVQFKAQKTTLEYITSTKVEKGKELGWLPGDPAWSGHRFKEWRHESGTVAKVTDTINGPETITAYFDPVDIYTVEIRYRIYKEGSGPEQDPEETKMVTVDRSEISEEKPMEVESPNSFRKAGDVYYYPLMSEIGLIPGPGTGEGQLAIGIKDKHEEVTISKDDHDPKKYIVEVPYKVPSADYTVKYMLRKLDQTDEDPEYDEVKAVAFRGVEGAIIYPEGDDEIETYADFESADSGALTNGRVYEVKYKRKDFTVTYDSMGGAQVESITDEYESAITLGTTTRYGYTFAGWYTDRECTTPVQLDHGKYILNGNVTLYAKWNADIVNYTIIYMFEKYNDAGTDSAFVPDDSATGTAHVGETVWANSASLPPKHETKGWEKDTAKNANSKAVITADGSAVLFVYYKLKEYTITFNAGTYTPYYTSYNVSASLTSNGRYYSDKTGTIFSIPVKLGENISRHWPSNVTGTYYYGYYDVAFNGWYNPEENTRYVTKRIIVAAEMLPDNGNSVTYTARWTSSANTYTVNYYLQNADDDGYTISDEYSQTYTSSGSGLGAKEIPGYTHDESKDKIQGRTSNFYYNRDTYEIIYMSGNTELSQKYNVKFDANINKTPYTNAPIAAECGMTEDDTFLGWYSDAALSTPYVFDKMPASKLILYAKWEPAKYEVRFHLNYKDATPEPYRVYSKNTDNGVERGKTVSTVIDPDDMENVETPAAPEGMVFAGWYKTQSGGDDNRFYIQGTPINNDMDVYAQWKPKTITQYKVHYLTTDKQPIKDSTGRLVIEPEVTKYGNFRIGEEITEKAPYLTGFDPNMDDDTLIADVGEQVLTISADESKNELYFYYDVKPDTFTYTVHYVVHGDRSKIVHDPVTKTISSSFVTVTESALDPDKPGYENYKPTKVTQSLTLGRKAEDNVIYFEYSKGASVKVSYLDMGEEPDPIPGVQPIDTYVEEGTELKINTALDGYTFVKAYMGKDPYPVDNGKIVIRPSSNTETYEIKLYYKYKLSVLARSFNKEYDGQKLTKAGTYSTESATEAVAQSYGLKTGHKLAGVTLSGEIIDAGTVANQLSAAKVSMNGASAVNAGEFYDVTYVDGTLTVTKANVTLSLEPDRWTGNVYDGTTRETGFTNGGKQISEYIKISNTKFRNEYLNNIWAGLIDNLDQSSDDIYPVTGSGQIPGGASCGLSVIAKKDAGDYYEPASTFEASLNAVISSMREGNSEQSRILRTNYNVIPYVRESRLEIKPLPVRIVTNSKEGVYTGEPLTDPGVTLYINNSTNPVTPDAQHNVMLTNSDTIGIITTGSQTKPGKSRNTYLIDWKKSGTEVFSDNFAITEELGVLQVNGGKFHVVAQDIVKAYGDPDPDFEVIAYYDDGHGNPTDEVLPSTLTHWGGMNYTLQLKDDEHGFGDNVPITIHRETSGEAPGVYDIIPADTPGDDPNYDIVYHNGKFTIAIARVKKAEEGEDAWTYHEYLVNPDASATGSKIGAFDRANSLEGSVIVETLSERVEVDSVDRYALTSGFTFDKPSSIMLRTKPGSKFKSTISRLTSDSMFTCSNGKALTVENIVLDGARGKSTATNGGLVNVQSGGRFMLGSKATLQKSDVSGKGGAVYVASGGVMNMPAGEILSNSAKNGGGGIYLEEGSTLNISGRPSFDDNKSGNTKQDIHIAGYYYDESAENVTVKEANSLVVNGDLSAKRASIYVWVEKLPHYKTLQQFAKYTDNVSAAGKSVEAFRNARPASDTDADQVGGLLYGIVKKSDNNDRNIYWYGIEGTRKVILRKVASGSYEPQKQVFKVCNSGKSTPVSVGKEKLEALTSGDDGIIWIGKLPYGTYDVVETSKGKKVFTVIVTSDGVYTRDVRHK